MNKKKAAKVLTRKDGSKKKEQESFMFSSALKQRLFSDYIALKLNYHQEPLTLAFTILVQMIEVVEKALKLYLAQHLKCQDCLEYFGSNFGHNISKLRAEAAKINPIFDEPDIVSFCRPLDDRKGRLYQYLRYGSQFTIEGMSTDLDK